MSFIKRLKNVIEAKANKVLDKHEDPNRNVRTFYKEKRRITYKC